MGNILPRESLIMSFLTNLDMTRTLNIPDPRSDLTAMQISNAALDLIDSRIFSPHLGSGAPDRLTRAVRESVFTNVLF